MSIPTDSIPQIEITKIGNTTFVSYVFVNRGIDFKVASTIKRTLESYKNGVRILPNVDEPILNNFYIDRTYIIGTMPIGVVTNEDLLNKIAENKMFQ